MANKGSSPAPSASSVTSLPGLVRWDPFASPAAKRRAARSVGKERPTPRVYEVDGVVFLDDPGLGSATDIGARDADGRLRVYSFAAVIESVADDQEGEESGDGVSLLIAERLRAFAAEVREAGANTARDWLAVHPLLP